MTRRDFAQMLAVAAASGLPIASNRAMANADGRELYDLDRYGSVSLLHMTDSHAQLLPIYFREPSVNIGVGEARGRPPHLVGSNLLRHYGIAPGSREAHALSDINFAAAAQTYGKVGGYAHLATLIKRLKQSRPGALLLDGGDTWQGSATALWTQAQDMVYAQLALGVNVMTGHWEFTYGMARVRQIVDGLFKNRIAFVAQNIKTADFGDEVFPPYVIREVNGIAVAVIGQSFPYTPIANPRHLVAEWSFGIQEERLQEVINEARAKGAQLIVLLSHNGMDVDLKLASRVTGLDAILGGHTHDGMPQPIAVRNASGETLVTNAGSNGKFLGVLDFEMRQGKRVGWQYKLLPVFANLLPADSQMSALIARHRKPFETKLGEILTVSEGLMYRRGNFNGSFDQVILDGLMAVKDAEIAFSPGFRWGTTLLPGDPITLERLMDQTAITYPAVTLNELSGEQIKAILEDVCDNLFNADPYYQQGGDMVRVGGLQYACTPAAPSGRRISDLRLRDRPLEASRKYRVAGWASVAENVQGEAIWDVVATYLRAHRSIPAPKLNLPRLIGVDGNPGIA